jgi:ABC-type branched-subunit amino acid transport system ATPase component
VIRFLDQDVTGMEAEDIAEIGIACIPEGRRIFPGLAVIDNLMLGATPRKRTSREDIQKNLDRVFGIFPQPEEFKGRLGWQLSGGQLQMLAIGRGLMANSKIPLLDEPSLGLAPVVAQEVFRVIKEINKARTTILLVEQNARMAPLSELRFRIGDGQGDAGRYGHQSACERRDEGALPRRPRPCQGGAPAPSQRARTRLNGVNTSDRSEDRQRERFL